MHIIRTFLPLLRCHQKGSHQVLSSRRGCQPVQPGPFGIYQKSLKKENMLAVFDIIEEMHIEMSKLMHCLEFHSIQILESYRYKVFWRKTAVIFHHLGLNPGHLIWVGHQPVQKTVVGIWLKCYLTLFCSMSRRR